MAPMRLVEQDGEQVMSCGNTQCPFIAMQSEYGPFSEPEIRCLVSGAVQKVSFKKGDVLFLQGQPSSSLYSLTEGTVKICSHSADGREQIVGLSTPGNLLVGLQSMNDDCHAYSAFAATAVQACRVNHKALLASVQHRSDVAMRLVGAMNAQLAHSRALMEVMGHKCAAAKIASFILLMTPKSRNGCDRFELPFSRLEMASLLGLSEETVCRLMASMKRSGAIFAPRGKVEIRDWKQLHAISDGLSEVHLGVH
jgi:CRP/FNR family transcriptional regulator